MCVCIYIYIYVYICVHICICVYIYIYIYIDILVTCILYYAVHTGRGPRPARAAGILKSTRPRARREREMYICRCSERDARREMFGGRQEF